MKRTILFAFSLFCALTMSAQVFKSDMAQFKYGDDASWKDTAFDDSGWMTITTLKNWTDIGINKPQSFGWYRIHFTVDKDIFTNVDQQETLQLTLPYVDDVDATYVNGVLVGQTGRFPDDAKCFQTAWSEPRVYNVPARCLNFGGDNVVAVRVWNGETNGGMYEGTYHKMHLGLTALSKAEFMDITAKDATLKGKKVVKIDLENKYDANQKGVMKITSTNPETGAVLSATKKNISVAAHKTTAISVPVVAERQRVEIEYTVAGSGSKKNVLFHHCDKYILTPQAPAAPRFNMSGVFGVRPNSPVIYRLPVSGERPMTFSTKEALPEGLKLDTENGIISGNIEIKGDYVLNITAENGKGKATAKLTIKVGDTIALTPPMGWNSWNCWGLSVTQDKVISSAQALLDKGLADYGYSYINVDDSWEAENRNADGTIAVNEKFPDMKGLGDWLHSKGLKFGIYSSPGDLTCGGYLGSIDHELQDAESYNSWGVDYLKYDWCGYETKHVTEPDYYTTASYVRPYLLMERYLRQQPRDIFYSLCQYGMHNVWEWGQFVDANSWRTTGDITDTWESLYGIGFEHQRDLYPYAGPGHWNDPDMLIVGKVGWSASLRDSRLTPDEQYTHISLWCLLASNMLIGCDIAQMDDFTCNLLCNNEVNAINQDILGKQAKVVYDGVNGKDGSKNDGVQIWMRPLSDGGYALGIFNLTGDDMHFNLSEHINALSLGGKKFRDLWRQKDVTDLNFFIPTHGVIFLKAK